MAYKVLDTEIIFSGRAFSLRRDHLQLPNGNESRLDIIDHVGSVVILPVDQDGNLLFVRQYRHAAGLDLLELPAGMLNPGEDPEGCAHREIREETGMAAGTMAYLGAFFLAPGYSTEHMHVFLARDLHTDPLDADDDEFISLERLPLAQAFRLAAQGGLPDAKSLAALFLAAPLLKQGEQGTP